MGQESAGMFGQLCSASRAKRSAPASLRASQERHWIAETFAAVGDISANLLHNMNNKVGTIPVAGTGHPG